MALDLYQFAGCPASPCPLCITSRLQSGNCDLAVAETAHSTLVVTEKRKHSGVREERMPSSRKRLGTLYCLPLILEPGHASTVRRMS